MHLRDDMNSPAHNRHRKIAPPSIGRAAVTGLVLAISLALLGVGGASAQTPTPPPNDNLAAAQVIHGFPLTVGGSTVGATSEPNEAQSACAGQPTGSSVWYSLRSANAQRIAVDMAAAGTLDAVIDVYHAVRSQLQPVSCDQTDSHGKASLSFKVSKNGVYEIRVAALQSSALASFTLENSDPGSQSARATVALRGSQRTG